MDLCSRFSERAVIFEPAIGHRICTSCGSEHATDIFQSQAFTSDGRATGVLFREYGYRDLKIYRANETISDIISHLNLSDATVVDVTDMISKITEGEFGMGEWFSVLISACAYVTMRQKHVPLSMAEAASAVGCDVHEIGRMVMRVLDHATIALEDGEYINKVTGFHGRLDGLESINSITFFTNREKTYGPYGLENGTMRDEIEKRPIPFQVRQKKIVGFHGTTNYRFVSSIGFYVSPIV